MSTELQTQAILLLTAWFTKPAKGDPKPLTPTEWSRFAKWLHDRGASPDLLLTSIDLRQALDGWTDASITEDRLRYLLDRSAALGLALEKWHRAGIWTMTRSDPDYPRRLWRRLKGDSPPLLFGCGNRKLLDQGGIAVIGSRDATDADLRFTAKLGGTVAEQGSSIVSGGARGVDETAMLGALEREGIVVGVLADSLLRATTSSKYRKGLMEGNLVLVSPFNPGAGFDVGNAMARNKYVYCLSDAAVVVATSKDKGGTWNGAIEDLKHGWVPLWVKSHPDRNGGNAALVERGAVWLPDGEIDVASLIEQTSSVSQIPSQASLFDSLPANGNGNHAPAPPERTATDTPPKPADDGTAAMIGPEPSPIETLTFYDFFLHKLAIETAMVPLTAEDLQDRLGLTKTQLNDWLKQAVIEGKVKKHTKPVRYGLVTNVQTTLAL